MTLTMTRTAEGTTSLSVDLIGLFHAMNGQTPTTSVPTIPTIATETPAPTTRQPKAPTSRTTTPKADKAPKVNGKVLYAEIRSLTEGGKHDEAKALATTHGWTHVIASIDAHQAKQNAEGGKALTAMAAKAGKVSAKQVAVLDKVADKVVQAEQPKAEAPKRPGRPQCPNHHTFLRGDGSCGKCEASKVVEQPKAETPAKPAKPAKAPKVKADKPKAQPKVETATENVWPEGLSEADLVMHWGSIAQRAIAAGPDAIARVATLFTLAVETNRAALRQAVVTGDKPMRIITSKREANLKNILANLASKPF